MSINSVEAQIREAKERAESFASSLRKAREQEAIFEDERQKWVQSFEEKSIIIEQLERELESTVDALNVERRERAVRIAVPESVSHRVDTENRTGPDRSYRDVKNHPFLTANQSRPYSMKQDNDFGREIYILPEMDKLSVGGGQVQYLQAPHSLPVQLGAQNTPNASSSSVTAVMATPSTSRHAEMSNLLELLRQAQEETNRVRLEATNLRGEKEVLGEQVSSMQRQIDRLTDDRDQLVTAIRNSEGKLQFRNEQVLSYEREKERMAQREQELTKQLAELQRQIQTQRTELATATSELRAAVAHNTSLEQRIVDLAGRAPVVKDLTSPSEGRGDLYWEERLDEEHKKYSSQLHQSEQLIRQLQTRLSEVEHTCSELKARTEAAEQANKQLEVNYEQANKQLQVNYGHAHALGNEDHSTRDNQQRNEPQYQVQYQQQQQEPKQQPQQLQQQQQQMHRLQEAHRDAFSSDSEEELDQYDLETSNDDDRHRHPDIEEATHYHQTVTGSVLELNSSGDTDHHLANLGRYNKGSNLRRGSAPADPVRYNKDSNQRRGPAPADPAEAARRSNDSLVGSTASRASSMPEQIDSQGLSNIRRGVSRYLPQDMGARGAMEVMQASPTAEAGPPNTLSTRGHRPRKTPKKRLVSATGTTAQRIARIDDATVPQPILRSSSAPPSMRSALRVDYDGHDLHPKRERSSSRGRVASPAFPHTPSHSTRSTVSPNKTHKTSTPSSMKSHKAPPTISSASPRVHVVKAAMGAVRGEDRTSKPVVNKRVDAAFTDKARKPAVPSQKMRRSSAKGKAPASPSSASIHAPSKSKYAFSGDGTAAHPVTSTSHVMQQRIDASEMLAHDMRHHTFQRIRDMDNVSTTLLTEDSTRDNAGSVHAHGDEEYGEEEARMISRDNEAWLALSEGIAETHEASHAHFISSSPPRAATAAAKHRAGESFVNTMAADSPARGHDRVLVYAASTGLGGLPQTVYAAHPHRRNQHAQGKPEPRPGLISTEESLLSLSTASASGLHTAEGIARSTGRITKPRPAVDTFSVSRATSSPAPKVAVAHSVSAALSTPANGSIRKKHKSNSASSQLKYPVIADSAVTALRNMQSVSPPRVVSKNGYLSSGSTTKTKKSSTKPMGSSLRWHHI